MNKISKINIDSTIKDALKEIDNNNLRSVAVLDEDRFIGLVTDGDIRRWILKGNSILDSVEKVVNKNPLVVSPSDTKNEIEKKILINDVLAVPVVENGKYIGMIKRGSVRGFDKPNIAALVMAGGLGTRLRPLTASTPKPMLPINGIPMLEIILMQLRDVGIKDIFISVRYLKDKIIDYFADGGKIGVRIEYIVENEPLGTIGAISKINDNSFEDIVVMNGDVLTGLDFEDFYEYHKSYGQLATICCKEYSHKVAFGVVKCDMKNEFMCIEEKPNIDYLISTGIYIFSKKCIEYAEEKMDAPELIKKIKLESEPVWVYKTDQFWEDVGTVEDYRKINNSHGYINASVSNYTSKKWI